MKKLSELSDEQELYCPDYDDTNVMSKSELMTLITSGDIVPDNMLRVYIAVESQATFNLSQILEMIEREEEYQEQYEDWTTDMIWGIREAEETKSFISLLNQTAKKNMTYNEGERVEVDITNENCVL